MKLLKNGLDHYALRVSLIYTLIASLWILFSDQVLAWLIPGVTNLTLLQTLKGLGFVGVTGSLLFWFVHKMQNQQNPPFSSIAGARKNRFIPIYLFAAMTVGIGSTGWLTYSTLEQSMTHNAEDNIASVGKLKAEMIQFWVSEALLEGDILTMNSPLARDIGSWLRGNRNDRKLGDNIQKRLQTMYGRKRYNGAILYDTAGQPCIISGLSQSEAALHRGDAMRAIKKGSSVLVDVHFMDAGQKTVELGFASPVYADKEIVGAIYFSIDPAHYLYPMLARWPVKSETSETTLWRAEGNEIVSLSPLRHANTPPLMMRFPRTTPDLPAALASNGHTGLVKGRDYRGVEVLAYVTTIEGTAWGMASEIDKDEALLQIRRMGQLTTSLTLLLLAVTSALLWLWWRREQDFFLSRIETEKQLLSKQYDYLSRYANDGILLTDENGHFIEANERAAALYGYSREEMTGMAMCDLRNEAAATYPQKSSQLADADGLVFEAEHKRKNGSLFPAEISARLIEHEGHTVCHMVVRDITERKLIEAQLARITRYYAASSVVNEILVRHWQDPEDALMLSICKAAVEVGGMKMAWLGRLDADTQRINPIASFGDGREYLDHILISVNPDIPEGRGPSGTSLRELRPVSISDFLNDPQTEAWHERGKAFGWVSSAAFPILRGGRPYAVLTVYHGQHHAFDQETVNLMMEMAGNIGFALDVSDNERLRNELQLQLSRILEVSPACIYTLAFQDNSEGSFLPTFVSANIEKLTGYPTKEWLMTPTFWAEHLHPDDRNAAFEAQKLLLKNGRLSHQYRFLHADGSYRWINDQLILVRDATGEPKEIIGAWTDSTDLMVAQQFVRESERRLTLLLGNLPGMAFRCEATHQRSMKFVSQGCEGLTGYLPEQLLNNFHIAYHELILPEDRRMVDDLVQAALDANRRYQINYRIRTAAGDVRHVWEQGVGITNAEGSKEAIEGLVMDITPQFLAEQAAREKEIQLRSVGDNLPNGFVYQFEKTAGGEAKFNYISAGVERTNGLKPEQVIQDPACILDQISDACKITYAQVEAESEQSLTPAYMVIEFNLADGEKRWLQVQSRPHRTSSGGTAWDGVAIDITQNRIMQDRIAQLTRFDATTGFPNQTWFLHLLGEAIDDIEGGLIAVARIDIDNFSEMEDRLGLEPAEAVLRTIISRMSSHAGDKIIQGRLDHSSFALAYLHITDADHATQAMQSLLQNMIKPMLAGGNGFTPLLRIGVSFYPNDSQQPMELLHQANLALNQGRQDKHSSLHFYTQHMNELLQTKVALIGDIRRAIEKDEFELYYLPQVDLASGRIVGAEALVRWNHPVRGFLPPAEFIGLAEESGQIEALGGWILRKAIGQMKEWFDAGHTDLAVTVNASALQTESGELIDLLQELLGKTGLPPNCLELELNEKALSLNSGKTQQWMQKLKSVHILLSIDDFGTGYSSLFYLKEFAVDMIKIDKSFIDDLTTDHNNAVIVQATIAMAHGLGLKVVAEGVETQAQANYLRTLHCDQIQGFLYSPPVKAEAILPMLRSRTAPVVPTTEAKRTLLLVDDEPNVIASLKRILRRDGYEILTAASGQEALQLLAQHPVNVIVSDQRMPTMTGVEFLSKVKVMHPNTIRIILSGYTEVNTITEAVNKGEVYKFLTKPWDDNELRAVIQEAFQRNEVLQSQE